MRCIFCGESIMKKKYTVQIKINCGNMCQCDINEFRMDFFFSLATRKGPEQHAFRLLAKGLPEREFLMDPEYHYLLHE